MSGISWHTRLRLTDQITKVKLENCRNIKKLLLTTLYICKHTCNRSAYRFFLSSWSTFFSSRDSWYSKHTSTSLYTSRCGVWGKCKSLIFEVFLSTSNHSEQWKLLQKTPWINPEAFNSTRELRPSPIDSSSNFYQGKEGCHPLSTQCKWKTTTTTTMNQGTPTAYTGWDRKMINPASWNFWAGLCDSWSS